MAQRYLEEQSEVPETNQAIQGGLFKRQKVYEGSIEQAGIELGLRASQHWPKSRNARIKRLRAQIEAGTYEIDGIALAREILSNETQFFPSH